MNVLFISDWGGGLALALRLRSEGHAVQMWIKDPHYRDIGDGMLEKVSSWEDAAQSAEFAICDDVGLWEIADKFRDRGIPVWGGTGYSDRLELDRGFGQREFDRAGLSILPNQSFRTIREGLDYLRQYPGRYVFKPNGTAQEDKILTYVGRSQDGNDLATFMEHLERHAPRSLESFELQKFESGVEIGVSGFYNGSDFVEPIEITFEHKKLMTGDIGPATFEMGTTLLWTTKSSRLYRETIGKMNNALRGYVGYIDINCICHEQTIYPLEATCRFGYPTLYVNMEGLSGGLGSTMYRIARGEAVNFTRAASFAACVVVASPPWPYASEEVFKAYGANNMVIVGGASEDRLPEGIYPGEMRYADGDFYTAGCTGFTAITAGAAETIEEALALAYNRANRINIPNMMYRTDIGATWHSDMACLREWCWLD